MIFLVFFSFTANEYGIFRDIYLRNTTFGKKKRNFFFKKQTGGSILAFSHAYNVKFENFIYKNNSFVNGNIIKNVYKIDSRAICGLFHKYIIYQYFC